MKAELFKSQIKSEAGCSCKVSSCVYDTKPVFACMILGSGLLFSTLWFQNSNSNLFQISNVHW